MCHVLRNSPLRLERVSTDWQDNPALTAPTLGDIPKSYPGLTLERLQQIPDNQILVFWGKIVTFSSAELGKISTQLQRLAERSVLKPTPARESLRSQDSETEGLAESAKRYFILLSSGLNGSKKMKSLLEVAKIEGIWVRLDTAEIGDEVWSEAVITTDLIVLG